VTPKNCFQLNEFQHEYGRNSKVLKQTIFMQLVFFL